ncbi:transcriptional regulator [Mycobacterium sp. EPG1]|nr:transcriptional regulator [Mycobacterium sp. EPG1]
MTNSSVLGSFLRWHRHRLTPQDVGLPDHGRRRVPGLRREEVAQLAGISTEYYIRLEQGRERSPSVAVVDALADALRLDVDEAAHLHRLTRPVSRRGGVAHPRVPDGVLLLIDQMDLPAILVDRYMDVVASNSRAQALFPNMEPDVSRLHAVFLDPREREFWVDWEQAAAESVAQLRADIGNECESPRVQALIADLRQRSRHFGRLWSRQEVQQRAVSPVRVRHCDVGELELHREKFAVTGAERLHLYIYFAAPDSMSAGRLARLWHRESGSAVTRNDPVWMGSR